MSTRSSSRKVIGSLAATVLAGLVLAIPVRSEDQLIAIDGAFVSADDDGWAIGNGLIRYALGRDGNRTVVRAVLDPTGARDWHRSETPDSYVVVNGQRIEIGSGTTEFTGATTEEHWGGVRLNLAYRRDDLEVVRSYAVYPGSPVVETWTTYTARGPRTIALSDLNNYSFAVENGPFRWITGLNTPADSGGAFTHYEDLVDDGQVFSIGSDNRASEQYVPWFSVRIGQEQFFGGILWGGSWRLRARRQSEDLALELGLPSFVTNLSPGAALESPHAFFGLTNRVMPEPSMALRAFIDKGVRHGRGYGSHVTYNTWYSYGTFIDEGSLEAEMDLAAALGVEQFVVDAGWWTGIDPGNPANFVSNWGSWQVDPERFPNGLGALSDHAHARGMRFGVWVEPERVALTQIDREGLARERYLAKRDGRYDPALPNLQAHSALVCLADPEARDWAYEKIAAFITEARPDYLKWDNNFWLNCNRPGHSHGLEDGNFSHTRGLNMLLERIRVNFPALEIENCASGGNRMSLDMLAYTDTAWLDDRTYPSTRARHNLAGLSVLFPAPYLLSFAVTTADEPVTDDSAYDLPLIMRSRMSGMLGMSWLGSQMGEGTRAALSREISLYKQIRSVLTGGNAVLLTRQQISYPDQPWSGWDVIMHISPTSGDAVILGFNTPDAPAGQIVFPKGLRADRRYEAESADYGAFGTATGADLMTHGIRLNTSGASRSHVVFLRAQ